MKRLTLLVIGLLPLVSMAQHPLLIPDTLSGTTFQMTLDEGTYSFFPGTSTQTMGVNGPILGPTLLFNRGDSVTLHVTNHLDQDTTTIHWHGLHVAAHNDGGPHTIILPNTTWSPSFTVRDWAGTYWYHPHLHHKTNLHVSKGVAGMIIVRDAQEAQLNLPRTYGVNDIPLVIQTKDFDSNHEIVTHSNSDDALMVNATMDAYLNIGAEIIRMRVLNGSSQRSFNLGLSNNANFKVIGTDGGLLESSVAVTRLLISPGERYEILVDLTGHEGDTLSLMSYASELQNGIYGATNPGMGQMMTMTGYNPNPLNGTNFELLELRIGVPSAHAVTNPSTTLVTHTPYSPQLANITRSLTFSPATPGPNQLNGNFLINGSAFNMGVINYSIPINSVEIWQLTNQSGIAHPFHIHDVQFYILTRNSAPPSPIEQGRKDVILVKPMEVVTFITRFDDFINDTVPYMYHCHLLTHEDGGMMGQFVVREWGVGINEESPKSSFLTLYPNPSKEFVHLSSEHVLERIELYSINGELLQVFQPESKEFQIDLPKSGVYVIQVLVNGKMEVHRIVSSK